MALGAVDEDRDGREIIAVWQLAGMKHRAARYAKLLVAALAAPDRATPETLHVGATAVHTKT
jgi:hypothetical protein